jgi:hypothetical protein
LSLFPFFTGWLGENHFDTLPTAFYGAVLLMAAIAYYLLKTAIIAAQGPESTLAAALGNDLKGKISPAIYVLAIPLAFVNRWVAVALTSSSRSCGSCPTGGSSRGSKAEATTPGVLAPVPRCPGAPVPRCPGAPVPWAAEAPGRQACCARI